MQQDEDAGFGITHSSCCTVTDAHKTGVAQEAVKGAIKSATSMSAAEARQILEVQENVPWVQVTKRYKHLFDQNKKYGSFYLQSKVYRAWEALEQEYVKADKLTNEDRAAAQQILQQDSSEQQQQ
eukprot:GHRR01021058.1.p2 GENE.GHRR01021058.1~~GHRR01021058.1.p2  ORF type:complete len:125 (+),score=52.67 GHRR01021058.1:114-488(+)